MSVLLEKIHGYSKPKNRLVINPAYLLTMTDDTGMFQHGRFNIPDRAHGYTVDDNVRALIVAADSNHAAVAARLPIYLGFTTYCQRDDGLFRNFMGYDRRFLEEVGSVDSQGRTLWALGVVYLQRPEYRPLVKNMVERFQPHLAELNYIRSKAFAVLGLHYYLQVEPDNRELYLELQRLADEIADTWEARTHTPEWSWFEDGLVYENARLPQALFMAWQTTGQRRYLTIARQAAAFLERVQFEKGYLKLIGNQGWYYQGQSKAEFDEQLVDAGALVEMFMTAWEATGETKYSRLAERAFGWFLGDNCHAQALYDPLTGGCYDSLMAEGVNQNQGAESVLAFHLAWQSLQKADRFI